VVNALAREGGLDSTFWAGPETISRRMRNGEVAIEPTVRQGVKRLRLGFAGEDFSYSISLGLPDSNGHFMLPGDLNPAPRVSASIRRSSANASGPARSIARPACWWIATVR
jgi:hypothetical protein